MENLADIYIEHVYFLTVEHDVSHHKYTTERRQSLDVKMC